MQKGIRGWIETLFGVCKQQEEQGKQQKKAHGERKYFIIIKLRNGEALTTKGKETKEEIKKSVALRKNQLKGKGKWMEFDNAMIRKELIVYIREGE